MTNLQQWYPEDREKIAQLFVQHPPVFDEQDYYLVKNESDGDRLIAVLNPDLRTLYVLESYQ
jgi:lipocalin